MLYNKTYGPYGQLEVVIRKNLPSKEKKPKVECPTCRVLYSERRFVDHHCQ